MTTKEKKKILKNAYLKPKLKLRQERRKLELTTSDVASWVGLERRQYELKEKGDYPFNDYEMIIISDKLNVDIGTLFFE